MKKRFLYHETHVLLKIFTFKYDDISKNYITHFGKKAKKILNKLQLLSGFFGVCVCACLNLSRKERQIRQDVYAWILW